MYLVNHHLSLKEKKHLYDVFKILDQDGDGILQKEDLIKGYKKVQEL
jgi:Ca2+-binding EF-hand superfamily protein